MRRRASGSPIVGTRHQGHHRGPINGGYDGFFIFLFKECWEMLGFTIFCRKIINIYLES